MMKRFTQYTVCGLLTALATLVCLWAGTAIAGEDESAGNNLSYPVIWAEGVEKMLRTPTDFTAGPNPTLVTEDELKGKFWYQWGTNGAEHEVTPASCPPDPDEGNTDLNPYGDPFCDDETSGSLTKPAGYPIADNELDLVKAYLQKDTFNIWQAGTAFGTNDGTEEGTITPIVVDWIDWGDNLESVDWYTRSQVRAEVVLFKATSMLEYEMRHVDGWGENEVHGLAVDEGVALAESGIQATIYSHCARLTIQKLLVESDNLPDNALKWVPAEGWVEAEVEGDELIQPPIFNLPVYETDDGPGYYNAEINVKGKIIYGYTWNVRNLNDYTENEGEAAGDYRITFSFDETCGEDDLGASVSLNTLFDGTTQILTPLEDDVAAALAEETDGTGGGGEAKIDLANNLTYIDVTILDRRSSGNGGGGGNGFGGKK